jgi:hypothetical protein
MLDWMRRKLGEWEDRQRQAARRHQQQVAMDPALYPGSLYGGDWGGGSGGCDSGGGDCGGGDG